MSQTTLDTAPAASRPGPGRGGSLLRGIGLRVLGYAVTLLIASIAVFAICAALPGDVAQVILGTGASPAELERVRRELGLDRPLPVRYLEWIGGLLQGDLGTSALTRTPVGPQIASRLAVTGWLTGFAMLIAIVVAVPLGMLAAVRRRRIDGFLAGALAQIGLAVPAFWAGIVLVVVFAITLRWLPANGYVPLTTDPGRWASHLVLPVTSLAIVQAAVLARYVRSAFVEVLAEDYLRTARAIGWRRLPALLRHGLRNVAVQVITVLGLQLATVLVGAIVIEQVFTLPGLGSRLLAAVAERDLVVVQGIVMVLVAAVITINAVVDALYLIIDPRLRARGRSR